MKKAYFLVKLTAIATLIFSSVLLSCNTKEKENKSATKDFDKASSIEPIESIPDSIIQFLINSAAKDFNAHHPPTAIDFKEVKAGYIPSEKDKTYLICGEFLTQEEKKWEAFTTIKTFGYEQYIGENIYCQKAVFMKADNNKLSEEIKLKLAEIKKLTQMNIRKP